MGRWVRLAGMAATAIFLLGLVSLPAMGANSPVITSISPATAAAGQQITIYGSGFFGPEVMVGGLQAQVASSTSTQIVFTMPSAAGVVGQTVEVKVFDTYNNTSSQAYPITVATGAGSPQVTSIFPGAAQAGQTVQVSGFYFPCCGTAVSPTTMSISGFGTPAEATVSASNQMSFQVPPVTPGTYTISFSTTSGVTAQSNSISFTVVSGGVLVMAIGHKTFWNNGTAEQMDVAPFIQSSRTEVPVSFIAKALGAQVTWDPLHYPPDTVLIQKGTTSIELLINSTTYYINSQPQQMDVAPVIVNSRTFVPVAFVGTGLGAAVNWVAASKSIVITPSTSGS